MPPEKREPKEKRRSSAWLFRAGKFLVPFLTVMLPLSAASYAGMSRLLMAIRDNTVGAARESLLERTRILSESMLVAKRSAYEVANNPAAFTLASSVKTEGTGQRDIQEALDIVRTYSTRQIREIGYYRGIFYLDTSGNPVFSEGADELLRTMEPSSSEYHRAAFRGSAALVGPYALSGGSYVMVSSSPMYDGRNRYAGTAGIVIDMQTLLAASVSPRQNARFSYAVMDESGFILSGGNFDPHSYLPSYGQSAARMVTQALAGIGDSGFMELDSGREVLAVWEPLGVKPWFLMAFIPARDIRAPTLIAYLSYGGAILVAGVAVGFGIMISARLRARNSELKKAIDELADAQELLIQTERSAVLGAAVAGLAHELNTPIGVALTSSTFIHELTSGTDSGLEPENILSEVAKASEILENSLKRASSIVASFRRVSMGGANESPMVMELGQALEDVVNMLSGPLRDADAHPVFVRDKAVYVRASSASVNRVVAAIVAGASALPSQFGAKLFQVLVTSVHGKALAEFSLKPLPALVGSPSLKDMTAPRRYPGHTIDAGVIRTLVEKDLGGESVVSAGKDGGFSISIRLPLAST